MCECARECEYARVRIYVWTCSCKCLLVCMHTHISYVVSDVLFLSLAFLFSSFFPLDERKMIKTHILNLTSWRQIFIHSLADFFSSLCFFSHLTTSTAWRRFFLCSFSLYFAFFFFFHRHFPLFSFASCVFLTESISPSLSLWCACAGRQGLADRCGLRLQVQLGGVALRAQFQNSRLKHFPFMHTLNCQTWTIFPLFLCCLAHFF